MSYLMLTDGTTAGLGGMGYGGARVAVAASGAGADDRTEAGTEGQQAVERESAGAVIAAREADEEREGGAARERRGDDRYPVDGDAEVTVLSGSSGAVLLRGRIQNLSASGCYIQTVAMRRLPPGTRVELLFVVRGWLVSAKADSRFSRSKIGMGFRFVDMDTESKAKLDRLVVRVRGEDLVYRQAKARSEEEIASAGPSAPASAEALAEEPESDEQQSAKVGSWMDQIRHRR